jgi:hypothetical protein
VPSIEEVLARAKVPVRAVSICLDADLQAEHDELSARLEVINRDNNGKMAGRGEAREVADRILELEEQMRASEVTFKFRGLTKAGLKKITDRFPPPDPNPNRVTWDVEAGAFALIAASAVDPAMSEADAKKLLDVVSQGHADRMVGAAWLASTGSTQVPFSARASELTGGSGSK